MKTYNDLYAPMLDREDIKNSFHTGAHRKTRRKDVMEVLNPDNIDKFVEIVEDMLRNETFFPDYHIPRKIRENSCKKEREIVKPNYKYEQIIHHSVVKQFKQVVTDGLYEQTYGSIPGRGIHSGAKVMRKWIKRYKGRKFYVLKMDIRHFYNSIDRKILKRMLRRKIKDKTFLRLLYILVEYDRIAEALKIIKDNKIDMPMGFKQALVTHIAYGRFDIVRDMLDAPLVNIPEEIQERINGIVCERRTGIPLGYYTSQWFGNFYLSELDKYIVQTLKPDKYIRYADDMVITGRNKKKLHRYREAISGYLQGELALELKGNWTVFRFEYDTGAIDRDGKPITKGRMLDFMGFQFHFNRMTLRKGILYYTRRKALNIDIKKDNAKDITWYDASQMLSYMGSIRHSDTYGYYEEYIKPCVNIKNLKNIISKHSRKELLKYGNYQMADSQRNAA